MNFGGISGMMGRYFMEKNVKSMTAYGRGVAQIAAGRFIVEIQSLNRRFLEVSLAFPRPLMRFESDVREQVSKAVARGAVTVTLLWQREPSSALSITPNLGLAHALKKAWETVAKETQVSGEVTLEMLALEKDLLIYDEEVGQEEAIGEGITEAVASALEALIAARLKEGEALAEELEKRLALLKGILGEIEAGSEKAPQRYRDKLLERLKELLEGSEHDERVLKEIALYAERVDITEEIVRLKSHFAQFALQLESEGSKGKGCEFLLQEMVREMNTIGSKSADATVAQCVVRAKGELEKMREQVQNIE